VDDNRIGSACWYRLFGYAERAYGPWTHGILRAWSTDHTESESGPAHWPAAVIEDFKSMRCLSVHVNDVSFARSPE
jgi:hypothetical protein